MADLNRHGQNQHMVDAISSAERILMLDEEIGDPSLDDFLNGMADESPAICFEENSQYADFPPASEFGYPMRIPVWPVAPSPYSCSCCQTLRQFFHINGNHVLKLHIHGRLGLISHAIMEKFNNNMPFENHEYHMFDFCQESINNVKQFLVQYCDDRRREGYIMLQDPHSIFYDALCTGLDGNGSLGANIFFPQLPGEGQMNREGLYQPEGNLMHKSYIASQRERAGNMKVRDLVAYFHLPINDASKKLNLCPSAIKSICRKEGLLRWPQRKIKSIQNEISKKKQNLKSRDAFERSRDMTEIQELQRRLDSIYQVN